MNASPEDDGDVLGNRPATDDPLVSLTRRRTAKSPRMIRSDSKLPSSHERDWFWLMAVESDGVSLADQQHGICVVSPQFSETAQTAEHKRSN